MIPDRRPKPRSRLAAVGVALAVLLAASAMPAVAQERGGEVVGTVVEAGSGRAIVGATVVLEPWTGPEGTVASRDRTEPRTTATDRSGEYSFAVVEPGWYRLVVSRIGYRSTSLWLELPPEWRIRRSLGLEVQPVALRSLEVSVTSPPTAWSSAEPMARAASPGTSAFGVGERPTLDARAVTPDDVTRMATFGEPDVLRALQRLPGASGQGDYSAGVWTRGTPWGMTRILFDGLPLYHPLHLGGTASGLSADGLEAMLFLPGARPAALSEGAAGVVSFVTRRARADGRVGAALSPLALRAQGEDRWLDERVGLSVTARRSWWDVVDPPSIFLGESSAGVDYWFADVTARADVQLGSWGMLEGGGLWEEDRIDGEFKDLVGASRGRWGNRLGWVALGAAKGPVHARLMAGRSVHLSRTQAHPWSSFYDDGGVPTLDAMDLRLARSMARLEIGGATEVGSVSIEWNAGLDRARETLRQFGGDALDRQAPGVGRDAVVGWTRLWGQGTARVGSLQLSGGLVQDAPVEGDPPGLGALPNGTLRWKPFERLTLEVARGSSRQFAYPFTRAGRSFGPALGVDHVWIIAGNGYAPLTSEVSTVGAELRLPRGFGLSLTRWVREIDGISMDGVATLKEGEVHPVYAEGSRGSEGGHGVEATLWRRSGRVRGELAYSWGHAEMTGPDGSTWASPADRRHSVDMSLFAHLTDRLRLGGVFRGESGWPYVLGPWTCPDPPPEDGSCDIPSGDPLRPLDYSYERGPNYASFDLLADWVHPGKTVEWGVSLSVRNVFGRDNSSAFRPDGCRGTELISAVCESPIGVGEFSPGIQSPTPAVAIRVLF